MSSRIAKFYPVAYSPELLTYCRENQSHFTSLSCTNESREDLLLAMDLIQKHLPKEDQSLVLKRSKKFYAKFGVKKASSICVAAQETDEFLPSQTNQAKETLAVQGGGSLLRWALAKIYYKITFMIL